MKTSIFQNFVKILFNVALQPWSFLLQHFEWEVSVTEYYGHMMIILLIVFILSGNSYVTLVPFGTYVNFLNADDTLMDFDSITY
jgi:hypothetical protein